MKLLIGNSRRSVIWVIAIIVMSTVAAVVVMWRAPALNLAARDAMVRAQGTEKPPDEVVIVAIDETSIRRFGRFPWPRALMAQALRRLSEAHPKVIALNVLYHHRRMSEFRALQARKAWQYLPEPTAREVRVGLMGLGVMGQAAARALGVLGYRLRGWSRTPKSLAGVACFAGMGDLVKVPRRPVHQERPSTCWR